MSNDRSLRPLGKLKWAWMLFRAARAESKIDFKGALKLLDEAAKAKPLWAPERVQRAMLLLKDQRTREAHEAFAALRSELKGSVDPEIQYLRHYCTHMLSMMTPSSTQWTYEAAQAETIACRSRLKQRFPMITMDQIEARD